MISVITPTYNRPQYLLQLINSIGKMEGVDLELIIIDDNSTADIESILQNKLQGLNIHYFKNKANLGPGLSRKIGLSMSHGEYIVFADDDDYYTDETFFAEAQEYLESNNHLSCISGLCQQLYDYDKLIPETIKPYCNQIIPGKIFLDGFMTEYNKPQSTFTTVFSRKHLQKSGLFDIQMVNDSVIYMRALSEGDIMILDRYIGVYRIHNQNISNSISASFIIENLNEKMEIVDMLTIKGVKLHDNWLIDQFLITIDYYMTNNTKRTLFGIYSIYLWGIRHNTAKIRHIIKPILKYLADKLLNTSLGQYHNLNN